MTLKDRLLETDVFEDNEYLDKYCELILNNLFTIRKTYKTQRHHIIPKSYYNWKKLPIDNSSKNLVNLLYKDHVVAHCYLVLCSKNKTILAKNRLAISWVLKSFKFESEAELLKNLDIVQKAYEFSKNSYRYLNIKRSDSFKKKVSEGMKRYRKTANLSEIQKKIVASNRKTYENGFKKQGLSMFGRPFSTRSIKVRCKLDTGEEYEFDSMREAGLWWYEKFKPFGEKYAECIYQRRIKASIRGEEIVYSINKKKKNNKITITNIRWFKGGEAHE